ncbi:MAG: sigma-70 family RNA polymerase sigma factor [Desulfobacterota bacterium]|nr:sigma-70 family RNA polymerase sigma factor [Thermodesulfobacteriota bacterium]
MMDPVVAPPHRMTDDEDVKAVLLCQKGDVDAFEILVERHQKRMLNVAYRMLGDYDEACDVVQEAFFAAYRAIRSFRREAKFSTWLYGIVVNHARNRIKQAQSRSRHETRSIDDPVELKEGRLQREVSDCGESAVEQLEKKEIEARVQECIGALETEYREVLVLRDIQGFSYDEIGELLKLPDGTVKSRLFRARAAMKDCLAKVLGDWP